eukprot:Lankesteria_metandrocarpae@DN4014_c0_g1_i1.p1
MTNTWCGAMMSCTVVRAATVMATFSLLVFVLLAGEPLRHVYTINTVNQEYNEVCDALQRQRNTKRMLEVPRRVHMMWKSEVLPEEYASHYKTCEDMNPGWQFTLWTDSAIDQLVAESYPWLLPTIESYQYRISKFDAVRLVVLDKFGGIYLDVDANCTEPFDTIVRLMDATQDTLLGATDPIGFTNFFMISKLDNPFVKLLLNQLQSWQMRFMTPHWTIMKNAGPLYLHTVYSMYPCKKRISVITPNGIKKYLDHKQSKTWHQWDGRLMVVVDRYQSFFIVVGLLYLGVLAALMTACMVHVLRSGKFKRQYKFVKIKSKTRAVGFYDEGEADEEVTPGVGHYQPPQQQQSVLRVFRCPSLLKT